MARAAKRHAWTLWLVLGASPACGDDGTPGEGEATQGEDGSGTSAQSTTAPSTTTATATDPDGTSADASTGEDPCAVRDADDDDHDAVACGGDDCDDTDPAIHPDAPDGWVHTVVIGPQRSTVAAPDFGIGPDGVLQAVLLDADGPALVRVWSIDDGASWDQETVPLDGALGVAPDRVPRLAIAGDGSLHVALLGQAPGNHVHGIYDGAWSFAPIPARGTPVAIDVAGDEIRVATGGGQLGRLVAGEWTFEPTSTAGNATSIDLASDAAGAAYMSVYNFDSGIPANVGTLYATDASGAWVAERLDPDTVEAEIVAVVTIGDTPNLVTQVTNATITQLVHWVPTPDDWQTEGIATFSSGAHGMSAVAGPDAPVVAFYEAPSIGTGGLALATHDGAWSVERVLTAELSGYDPRVALAPDGAVHLVYRQVDMPTLWHARRGDDGIDQNCDGRTN